MGCRPEGSVAKGYKWLHHRTYASANDVPWCSWVWNRFNLPKHKFICWLIMWKRVKVRNKLKQFGVIEDDFCPLCSGASETVEHLFFYCPYSTRCCAVLQQKLNMRISTTSLEECNDSLISVSGRFKRSVLQSCYAGLAYSIWTQRNQAVREYQVLRPEKMVARMLGEIYHRIFFVLPRT